MVNRSIRGAAMENRAFELAAAGNGPVRYDGASASVVVFVKEDCPTCREIMPLLAALGPALQAVDAWFCVGQTVQGNRVLEASHTLPFALLDDETLTVSYDYGIEIVPCAVYRAEDGNEARVEGFAKDDWQSLVARIVGDGLIAEPSLDWDALPDWRPGCGSLSQDPSHLARLEAEASGSPLRARRIEVGVSDDPFEFMFDQGFSDGLPLVPPTPERVLKMLAGTRRDARDVIATVPPNMGEATVEKVAINAVMAGCLPEYLPVVITALEAVCTDEFNIHGVMATTMGASPLMIVNGPIRDRIGMSAGMGALGQGHRANATIGRAVRLAVRNIGGARPGGTERSTLGNPMKFTMCFAEREERSNWEPLHVERGFRADESVVTVFAATSGPTLIVDQDSLSAHQLGGSIGLCLESAFHPKAHFGTEVFLVVCPEHVDTLARDGFSKADLRARIQQVTERPIDALAADDDCGVGFKPAALEKMDAEARARRLPKFRQPEDVHIVVAGGDAGKFSAGFCGWATGPIGSISVSRAITDAVV